MFTKVKTALRLSTIGISYDCIKGQVESFVVEGNEYFRLFFSKVILYAVFPLVIGLLTYAFWTIYYWIFKT